MGDIDIRFYWSLFWRRLHYFIAIVALVSAVGLAVAFSLPKIYRATSKLLIESSQIPEQMARSTVLVSGLEQIQIIEQKMMARENLLNLAKTFNIYGSDSSFSESDIVDDMAARTEFFQIRLEVPPTSGLAAFAVSFEAEDPNIAAEVAQAITKQILDENAQRRVGSADDTLQFFEQSVKNLDGDLSRLEGKLLYFKNENKDALPDSLDYRRNEQARQQERLVQLEREEASLRDRRSTLVRIFENTGTIVGTSQSHTAEEQMLEQLRRTLTEQQGIYSGKSPNMIALRSQIDQLQQEVSSQRAAGSDAGENKRLSELDIQLAEIDARLAFIKHEKSDISGTLADLKQSILATPANEIVLNSLERHYKNIRMQYDSAIARLAEATTGKQIEQRFKGERISVIEMATPPDKPIRSKRLAIAAGSVVGGIALSIGLFLLLEFLNKTIRRPADLVKYLEMRPFATIPYIAMPAELLAKKIAIGAMLLAALVVPVSALVVHYHYEPIGSLVERLTASTH